MPPPHRYTYNRYAATGYWYVYDHLLNRRVSVGTSIATAVDTARSYEADWRRACARWQQEEHGEGPPHPIF
jgi:hypothetical protein